VLFNKQGLGYEAKTLRTNQRKKKSQPNSRTHHHEEDLKYKLNKKLTKPY
jgi:hypothetical protein